MSCPRQLKNNHGMSIVEVLVVMVVLLIGIYSIVSMFPGGFRAVRHAESLTLADRLAQGEMERWKNQVENLPWGVVPVDSTSILNTQTPLPPIDNAKAANIRRILGETTKIPVGTPFRNTGSGIEQASIYTLAYSPIEVGAVGSTHGLVVTGGSLQRRILDLDQNSDAYLNLRPTQYGIDYELSGNKFYVYFRDYPVGRNYRISYSYWVQDASSPRPELRSQADQLVVRVDDNTGVVDIAVADTDLSGGTVTLKQIEDGSDSVSREFTSIAMTDGWNYSDPYEYKLVNPDLGILAFNPYGYNTVEQTPRGMQPLEAHVTYSIRDLTIMRDDRRVGDNMRVKLSLKYIMQLLDDIEDPEPFYGDNKYHGIWARTDTAGTMPQEDLVVIDLGTGAKIDLTNAAIDVDYEEGSITFPNGFDFNDGAGNTIPIQGRNLRILYKAEGDWSLQLQKAYEVYRRDYTGAAVDYRTYTVSNPSTPGTGVRLFFAPCDAAKMVAVDYAYIDPTTGIEHKVVGEAHQISDIVEAPGRCKITLDFTDTNKFGPDAAQFELTRIYSVTGISLKIRVLWKEGSKWRWVDKDTALMRKTTEV